MNKRAVGFYRGLLSGARRDKRIAESYSICPNLRPQPAAVSVSERGCVEGKNEEFAAVLTDQLPSG
jgi:hypothetical protein